MSSLAISTATNSRRPDFVDTPFWQTLPDDAKVRVSTPAVSFSFFFWWFET